MTEDKVPPLDENTRRYYLDVMGIQCWELIGSHIEGDATEDDNLNPVQFQAAGAAYQQLEADVQQCTRCQLHTGRKQAITGRGNASAELMFVLLSPDANDDGAGMLCSGEADTLFTKMLAAINIAIDDIYITSLLKCCVPARHTVTTTELHYCAEYLKQQIHLIQPKLLVVTGDTAARCLLQKNTSLDDLRAMVNAEAYSDTASHAYQFESAPLFVSYSPQELLQRPENKRKAWQDLQQLQQIVEAW